MSKGYHRLPMDLRWDNRSVGGYPLPVHKGAIAPEMAPREFAIPAAEFEPGPPQMTRSQATSAGFTGNSCVECGSMQMVRNGTCEKCNSCGSTTGCS